MSLKKSIIYDYYSEIKYRIYYSILTMISTLGIAYFYKVELLLLLTNYIANYNVQFIYTKPSELLFFFIELSLVLSIIFFLISVLVNITLYTIPALYYREYLTFLKLVMFILIYIIFCLYITFQGVIPYLTNYLITLSNDTYQLHYVYNVKTSELFSYFIMVTLGSFTLMIIPLVLLFILIYIQPNITTIHKIRIYNAIVMLFISALISPGDWMIQLILFICLLTLFELGIVIYTIYINI